MILQALNRYYDILAEEPESKIAPLGYSKTGVSYAINLSRDGKILDIIRLYSTVNRGKKTIEVPVRMTVPEQIKRSGSRPPPNFLCDNSSYVLGISEKDQTKPEHSIQRFEMFREFHIELLCKADCPEARAVIAFLNDHDTSSAAEEPNIQRHLPDILKGGNLVFTLEGSGYIHENPDIRKVWENHKSEHANAYMGQCLVTGDIQPIARLHASIKGIKGAQSTGATLVGFNDRAYESYNRVGGQGLNAPTSEKAAFAYTTALNYLLSSDNPYAKIVIGDTTVVYWAESPNKIYESVFISLFNPESVDTETEESGQRRGFAEHQRMREIALKIKRGDPIDSRSILKDLDEKDTRFYVLGLAPNKARTAIRFFYTDPFSKIVDHLIAHYQDMEIIPDYNTSHIFTPYQMVQETVSKKSKDKKASPLLGGALMRAVLTNAPYPAALYYCILARVRADMDDEKSRIRKINAIRAAIIKAYLIRKFRHLNIPEIQEVLRMSINKESTNKAYLLGRLFAVMEKAQVDAAQPVKLNATIKDRYFTSACASPATVFPLLLKLSQHHISKAKYGYFYDHLIEEIFGQMNMDGQPIPKHLNLDEQGIFVMGYYHQRQAFFAAKETKTDELNEKGE